MRTKQLERGSQCALCLKSAQLLALVSLEKTFGGREQRASSEKFAYANLTNRLTRGLRGIRVVVGHSTPANRAFERLSPQPFSACSVSQQKKYIGCVTRRLKIAYAPLTHRVSQAWLPPNLTQPLRRADFSLRDSLAV